MGMVEIVMGVVSMLTIDVLGRDGGGGLTLLDDGVQVGELFQLGD